MYYAYEDLNCKV